MPGTFICLPLSPFICLPLSPSLDAWHGSLGGRVHVCPFVSFICLPLSPSLDASTALWVDGFICHYFPTWNVHMKHKRCSRQSPMELRLTAGFGSLIYVSHRRAENVNSCEHLCVVQVKPCVLHNCVAHVSPHVHIRVFHVYTYACYKSAPKFVLAKHACVIQVCTSVNTNDRSK